MYRLKPNSWQPARLTKLDHTLVLWALIALPMVRAFDYSTGKNFSRSLVAVEAFAPLWAWAIAFWTGALVLIAGVVTKRHLVVYLGHSILAVTYSALMVGITISAFHNPWFDGIRGGSVLLLPAALHWLIWWRMGPAPLKPRDVQIIEGVGGPR